MWRERKFFAQNYATASLNLYASTCKERRIRYLYFISYLLQIRLNELSVKMCMSLFEQLH